ncbi:hypothetical protein BpHYR1_028790 [Brachionus plicatilis]|uniref:Uncharacterized protein n=1 Tax=Brachionus plicatilis TaxID=10195 RepID=A0A3M7RD75_BRAPC|nr:hypothetical protein BpHYR1_028790 [Brachionus plicatilis]
MFKFFDIFIAILNENPLIEVCKVVDHEVVDLETLTLCRMDLMSKIKISFFIPKVQDGFNQPSLQCILKAINTNDPFIKILDRKPIFIFNLSKLLCGSKARFPMSCPEPLLETTKASSIVKVTPGQVGIILDLILNPVIECRIKRIKFIFDYKLSNETYNLKKAFYFLKIKFYGLRPDADLFENLRKFVTHSSLSIPINNYFSSLIMSHFSFISTVHLVMLQWSRIA